MSYKKHIFILFSTILALSVSGQNIESNFIESFYKDKTGQIIHIAPNDDGNYFILLSIYDSIKANHDIFKSIIKDPTKSYPFLNVTENSFSFFYDDSEVLEIDSIKEDIISGKIYFLQNTNNDSLLKAFEYVDNNSVTHVVLDNHTNKIEYVSVGNSLENWLRKNTMIGHYIDPKTKLKYSFTDTNIIVDKISYPYFIGIFFEGSTEMNYFYVKINSEQLVFGYKMESDRISIFKSFERDFGIPFENSVYVVLEK